MKKASKCAAGALFLLPRAVLKQVSAAEPAREGAEWEDLREPQRRHHFRVPFSDLFGSFRLRHAMGMPQKRARNRRYVPTIDSNFVYDRVFGSEATQKEVYDYAAKPIINGVCRGSGDRALRGPVGLCRARKRRVVSFFMLSPSSFEAARLQRHGLRLWPDVVGQDAHHGGPRH